MATKKTASKTTKKSQKQPAEDLRSNLRNRAIELQQRSLELQETAFDRTYDAVNSMQERGEEQVTNWLDKAERVPAEAKNLVKEWIGFNQNARESYRATVATSFSLGQKWFDGLKKTA